MQHVAVAEDFGVQIAVEVVLIVLLHVAVPGLLTGDEGAVGYVGQLFQLALEGHGLLVGQILIHKGQHRVLTLQVLQILVGVVGHQREGAHDQQAGHGDADGREGHKPVGEHIADALPDKVTEIVSHWLTS